MHAPKRLARIAGVRYRSVGIFGALAEGRVNLTMYAAGDAAARFCQDSVMESIHLVFSAILSAQYRA